MSNHCISFCVSFKSSLGNFPELFVRDICLPVATGFLAGWILRWITYLRRKQETKQSRRMDLRFVLVEGSRMKVIEMKGKESSVLEILKELRDYWEDEFLDLRESILSQN